VNKGAGLIHLEFRETDTEGDRDKAQAFFLEPMGGIELSDSLLKGRIVDLYQKSFYRLRCAHTLEHHAVIRSVALSIEVAPLELDRIDAHLLGKRIHGRFYHKERLRCPKTSECSEGREICAAHVPRHPHVWYVVGACGVEHCSREDCRRQIAAET